MALRYFLSFAFVFSLTTLAFSSGWAKKYVLLVDAISNPDFLIRPGLSFTIISSDLKIDVETTRHRKASIYVKSILSGLGYYEAPNRNSADLLVDISYGMEEPHVDFTVRSTHPSTSRIAEIMDPTGRSPYPNRRFHIGDLGIAGGRNTRLVGTTERIIPKTIYEKFLQITVIQNQPLGSNEERIEAWSIKVIQQNESTDIDKYLPLLTAAAIPYFGQRTQSQEKVILRDRDESVIFVKEAWPEEQ